MIVGLTGGIGCGKSTVARLIRIMGYPVYDSDARARFLQSEDTGIINEMAQLLGEDILDNGKLNRKRVAEMVFNHPDLLAQLNKIVHPRVKEDFDRWMNEQRAPLLFKESALLVETGAYRDCDALILVTAPEELRIQRVVQRDGVSESEVKSRMARQSSDEEKQAVSDFTIFNDDHQLIIPQVERTLAELVKQKAV